MEPEEIRDALAHEFLLVATRHELDHIEDVESLRALCLQLVELCENQKLIFKQMMSNLISEE